MTVSLRIVLGLFSLSLLALALTGAPLYSHLSYLWGFLLGASWVWSRLSLRGLRLRRSVRVRRAEMGQVFHERFEIQNASRLPRLWLEVDDQTTLPGAHGSRVLSLLKGRARQTYTARTRLAQRGLFALGPTVLRSGDPFGLFPASRTLPSAASVLVYPAAVEVYTFPSPPGLLPGGEALRRRTHHVTPNAAGVREYVPGDPLNRIHWLSTARRDRLIAKEFELDPLAEVWILPDADQEVQAAMERSPRPVTRAELEQVLRLHHQWMRGEKDGRRADLRAADLRQATLRGGDVREADLREADLRDMDLREADLREADLRFADLWRADLRGADLRGANLAGADLRWANLHGAHLRGASLEGADLRGATYSLLAVLPPQPGEGGDEPSPEPVRWNVPAQPSYERLPPLTEEYSVSIAASLARYFLRRRRAVGLASCGPSLDVLPPDRGGRQLGKILEALALLRAKGNLTISALATAHAQHLPRGSTVILITPSTRREVALAVDQLLQRGLRPVAVLLDAASFGGPPGTEALAGAIRRLGVPVCQVENGTDLALALRMTVSGTPATN